MNSVCNNAGVSCAVDELSLNSNCYRKFHSQVTWFSASNDCLSRGGSLAVFTHFGRPSQYIQLTDWLDMSGTDKRYWVGLVRSWWKTAGAGTFWHPKQLGINSRKN